MKKKIEVNKFEKLIGLTSLWRISFDSDNEKAREDSRELLVDLHLRLGPQYKQQTKRQIMQSFIRSTMSTIEESYKNIKDPACEKKALNGI